MPAIRPSALCTDIASAASPTLRASAHFPTSRPSERLGAVVDQIVNSAEFQQSSNAGVRMLKSAF